MRSVFLLGSATVCALTLYCLPALAGPNQLVSSVDPTAGPPISANGSSWLPLMSPDGRLVLFTSTANNLLTQVVNQPYPEFFPARMNMFLRDRSAATTTLVSVSTNGTEGANEDCFPAGLSPEGRYAFFMSGANNLVAGDTNQASDVFVRDLLNQTTALVSISTNGECGNGESHSAVISTNRRYVAFVSTASNLAPNDTNRIADVFVRDLELNLTTLASAGARSTNHSLSHGGSWSPVLSADGRYVAFQSTATNLVPGVGTINELYLRDLEAGQTHWVSVAASNHIYTRFFATTSIAFGPALSHDGRYVAYGVSRPTPAHTPALVLRYDRETGLTDLVHTNGAVPLSPYDDLCTVAISADGQRLALLANTNGTTGDTTCVVAWDAATQGYALVSGTPEGLVPAGTFCNPPVMDPSGRYVAFLSSASNLSTNALSGENHLYLRDIESNLTIALSADGNGASALDVAVVAPEMSGDARFVAFEANDNHLVPGDHNGESDIFVRDLATGAVELLTARHPDLLSATPNGASSMTSFSASSDGRFIAFASDGANLVSNDQNRTRDVFVRDLGANTNRLVSVATNGFSGDATSFEPVISGDGRWVAFTSASTNLVTVGDSNRATDVFVRDLVTGTTMLASFDSTGNRAGNGASWAPVLSADGKRLLFRSRATNLAPGSYGVNTENVFLRDLESGTTVGLSRNGCTAQAITPSGALVCFVGLLSPGSAYLYVWDSAAGAFVYTNSTWGIVSAAISPDGNRIAWTKPDQLAVFDRAANSSNLVTVLTSSARPNPRFSANNRFLVYGKSPAGTNQLYLYDCASGAEVLVTHAHNSATAPANALSDSADVSPDGRFLVYRSAASDLVPGDANGVPDIFLFDRQTGENTLLSKNRSGSFANNRSLAPVFSADGQSVLF
ncbi:MAG TPA: hypothetical protein VN673_03015, partial [Clostridia bacterium]|nr:hypothetical protein [Clostridia bacterium]